MAISKALAFLRRDARIDFSYRFSFLARLAGIFFGVASFFFVAKVFGNGASPYLSGYGGDYFAFVLVGIAFLGFQSTGLSAFTAGISSAQAQGTLEVMLITPTKLSTIVLASSLWNFLLTAVSVLIYLAVGSLVFGADLGRANIPAAAVTLLLTVGVFAGFGILSASVLMVIKRGDPISWLFGSVSSFLGGTFFPVTVLPLWLQGLAYLFPIFYALRAMRQAVLTGAPVEAIAGDLLVLALFCVAVIPLSLFAFRRAVGIAKTEGTLGSY